jgi:hypothetical protein
MRARFLAVVLTLLAAFAGPARTAAAATATAPVSYLSGGSVYVDAGVTEGLKAGDTLSVLRAGRQVARVVVTFASSHRAACDTLWTKDAVVVGDLVSYTAAAPASRDSTATGAPGTGTAAGMAGTAAATGAPAAARAPAGRTRLRGRIGAGWLSVNTPGGGSFRQPSFNLRFDGTGLNGGRADVTFDMRNRRTTRSFAGSGTTVENMGRVYRAAVTMRAGNPDYRLTVGRQFSALLTSVSLFDGALFEKSDPMHTFGVFAGTQPNAADYNPSADIVEGGAFFEFHQPPLSAERWSVVVGGVTSVDHGHPNRDFAFAQGGWYSRPFIASFTQEIDINRSWKRENGDPLLSATSTFASVSSPLTSWFTANAGYDNRRNVRLYRDHLTPETEFDDQYRRGAWVGGQFLVRSHLRVGGDTRVSDGPSHSDSWSVNAEAWRLGIWNTSLRGRYSRYRDSQQDSHLQSFGAAAEPLRGTRFDFTTGVRSTTNSQFGVEDRERWFSVDADVTVGRSWYLGAGFEGDHGGNGGDTRQVQATLNRRF